MVLRRALVPYWLIPIRRGLKPGLIRMNYAPHRINSVTMVEPGSDRDRVAKALYDHDALQASVPWLPWKQATTPKRRRYIDRASVAIAAMK